MATEAARLRAEAGGSGVSRRANQGTFFYRSSERVFLSTLRDCKNAVFAIVGRKAVEWGGATS